MIWLFIDEQSSHVKGHQGGKVTWSILMANGVLSGVTNVEIGDCGVS